MGIDEKLRLVVEQDSPLAPRTTRTALWFEPRRFAVVVSEGETPFAEAQEPEDNAPRLGLTSSPLESLSLGARLSSQHEWVDLRHCRCFVMEVRREHHLTSTRSLLRGEASLEGDRLMEDG